MSMSKQSPAPAPLQSVDRRILSTFDELQRESLDLHTFFELAGGNPPSEREAVLDAVSRLVANGMLQEGTGGDFYRRTEDGRLAVSNPRDITLYTREGCHLCDEAEAAIVPLLSEFGAKLREVDIDADPELRDRYTDDVPVVFLGSRMVAQHRVDPAQLRREFEKAKP
jgi:glutaredoxin